MGYLFYIIYRLSIVSADHLAVQGGLTDVLRQLAVGFSRPQSQCLVSMFDNIGWGWMLLLLFFSVMCLLGFSGFVVYLLEMNSEK